jgi:hypothetical protein
MNEDQFWGIIERSRDKCNGEVESQAAELIRELSLLPEESIADYEAHFLRFMERAYDARLWAAGCILDELSDDGFTDFRAWLISRGRDAYFHCLENPEKLADFAVPGGRVTAEEINSVAYRAYSTRTGRQDFFERFSFEFSPSLKNQTLSWKTAEGFPDPERLCSLFPQLCRRFGAPS